jgi:hypothetical protein
MYKIEDDVPIPPNNYRFTSELTKALIGLNVGQSFIADKKQGHLGPYIKTAMRRGMKFKTRKESATTTRIWRVA